MDILLDIENTVIDDLIGCNWLEKNCEKIKSFIEINNVRCVHIYTWGWTTPDEINTDIVNAIYEKIGVNRSQRGWVLTKESSVDYCINAGYIKEEDKERALLPGMMNIEFGINKTLAFLFMTRQQRNEGEKFVLIDDTTETDFVADKNAITINPKDL